MNDINFPLLLWQIFLLVLGIFIIVVLVRLVRKIMKK